MTDHNMNLFAYLKDEANFKEDKLRLSIVGNDHFLVRYDHKERNISIRFDRKSECENHLIEAASFLTKRVIEVVKTDDGKYAVLYLNFDGPPTPKEDSLIEALRSFIDMMLKHQADGSTMTPDEHKKGEEDANSTGDTSGANKED